jgi:hypothetical protein
VKPLSVRRGICVDGMAALMKVLRRIPRKED